MEDIVRLYKNLDLLGPGGDEHTERALKCIGEDTSRFRTIDMGCGTGASAKVLSKFTERVTAVDLFEEFLRELESWAEAGGIHNIDTLAEDMGKMEMEGKADLVWCEAAVYNIGFQRGIRLWKDLIEEGGYLVVSDLLWLTEERPDEVETYWTENYPGIGSIEERRKAVEDEGYELLDSFILPEKAWTDYYEPLIKKVEELKRSEEGISEELAAETIREAEFYMRNKSYYSYVFFIMRKR